MRFIKNKREVDVVVISDVHLGTYGCRAQELLNYLKSVKPKTLVLNGDIIDIWQFSKRYFPNSHMQVVRYITSMLADGTTVYYVTGNHDEMLRKFKGFSLGDFHIVNKLKLELDGDYAWIFHGDVFDVTMKHSKWLAKLGGFGYDLLIRINTVVNWFSEKVGGGRLSFSKKIKDNVKGAVKYINNFEETVADLALSNGFRYVICGHIHQPKIKDYKNEKGLEVQYLNSGDWIENLTSLEFVDGAWELYTYDDKEFNVDLLSSSEELYRVTHKPKQLFEELFNEIHLETLKSPSEIL